MGVNYRPYLEVFVFVTLILVGYQFFIGIPSPPILKEIMKKCEDDILGNITALHTNLKSFKADDPRLIKYIQYRYLTPPSTEKYNLKRERYGRVYKYPTPLSKWVRNFYHNKRNGTFIEAGANEGEIGSHTIELETELGWTGLLVECNPTLVPYLRSKHRKAWIAGVCISTNDKFTVFNFSNPVTWSYSGRIGPAWNLPNKSKWTYFDVEGVPLYSIIAASGLREIDFMLLDLEGIELEVLKHFLFDRVVIKVIIVEIHFLSRKQRIELKDLLMEHGYSLDMVFSIDWVFVHESAKKLNVVI